MAEPPQEPNNNVDEEEEEEEGDENEEEEGEGEENVVEEEEAQIEEEEKFVSIFEILDAPRELPEPIELTLDHVKQIQSELGIIILCWPDIKNAHFEGRVNFPEEYTKNTEKEKFLLLYTENFRRQFVDKFPHRKPLLLAAPNEVGLMVSLSTNVLSLYVNFNFDFVENGVHNFKTNKTSAQRN